MLIRLLILFLLISSFSKAQCTLTIDSVTHTNVSCHDVSDGTITIYASGGNGAISFSNTTGGSPVLQTQHFDSPASMSTASGSGPTNRWWSPSSCTGGAYFQYSSTQGCAAGSALFTGSFNGYTGCFLRSPQLNMNGINTATVSFDLSNSYTVSRPNDRLRFYVWVNNSYLSVPAAYTVNGVSGQYLNFLVPRTCVPMTVTVDLSSVPINSRADFFFYLEADCQYSSCSAFQAVVDNITISQAAPTQASNTFTGLPAATYPITIMDAAGCTVTIPAGVEITKPEELTISGSSSACTTVGGSDGSVSATSSGGNGSNTYVWNTTPVQTGANATNLSAGNYQVTVTDSRGCTATTSIVVAEPSCVGFNITSVIGTAPDCNGATTGSINVTASGPNSGIEYILNGSIFRANGAFPDLPAGSYLLTARDQAGCSVIYGSNPVILEDPEPITPQIALLDGTLSTGIFSSYQWLLNGLPISGATNSIHTVVGNGTYTVEVTDESGCIGISEPFEVTSTAIETGDDVDALMIYPNPFSERLIVEIKPGKRRALIELFNALGQLVQTMEVTGSTVEMSTLDLPEGLYILSVKGEAGAGRKLLVKAG